MRSANLKVDEPILQRCGMASVKITLHKVWATVMAILIFFLVLMAALMMATGIVNLICVGFTVIVIALYVVNMISFEIKRRYTVLAITRHYIVGHTGFINTADIKSPISKVSDVETRSGLIGKIFGYETILVHTMHKTYKFTNFDKAEVERFCQIYYKIVGMREEREL